MNKRIRKKRGLLKPLATFTCACGRRIIMHQHTQVTCKCGAWHSWGPFGFTTFEPLRFITLDV